MPSSDSMINKNDSYQGNSHKRKHSSQKQMESKGNSSDLPPRTIGEDGHYYECVVCDVGGELLCCDTCPNTYHLQCLSPALDLVPTGNWQCRNCSEVADLSTPLSSLQRSKKKASSDKNPSVDALHSLAEAGALLEKAFQKCVLVDEQQNVVNHNGDAEEHDTSSAVKGIKVYTRRAGKEAVGEADAKLTTYAETLLTLRPVLTEQPYQAKQNDHNASGRGNEGKESNQPVPPRSGETFKEKFARLRLRQKQRIALRNKSRVTIPGSRIFGHASMHWLNAGTIESVRVHTPESSLRHPVFLDHLPLRQISPSMDDVFSRLNSCRNLSILRDLRRFRWLQKFSSGLAPVRTRHQFPDHRSYDISSLVQNQPAVPRVGNYYPMTSPGSNVSSSSQSTERVWNNTTPNGGMIWIERELDSLWLGVRKFGQGNWVPMLRDTTLYFSKLKTAKDLAEKWHMEKVKIVNSVPYSEQQVPQNSENPVTQKLFLGGMISIPKMKMEAEESVEERNVIKIEDDV